MKNQVQHDASKIRLLIAEDHHIVRDALRKRLSSEMYIDVVGEAADGSTLQEVTSDTRPDLVLMDAEMPKHKPGEATLKLREIDPDIKIIILSMHASADFVVSAFQAGANGYVLKDDPVDTLFQAIRHVMSGKRWVSQRLGPILATFVHDGDVLAPPDLLTEREQEVLLALAKGYRNDKIADTLVIAENTVRNHIASIFQKLGVETRVEAVVYALSQQLITLGEIVREDEVT